MSKAEKSAAVLTIFRAGEMTKKGRKDVAKWLRRQADHFEDKGDNYSLTRYTARYMCRD